MVKCAAITSQFRACRGHADPETGVCHKHADWWNDKWLLFLVDRVNYFSTDRQLKLAREVLLNPRAVVEPEVPELDINQRWGENPHHRRYSILVWYSLLVETGRIQPMNVPGPWIEKVRPMFGILSDMITVYQPAGYETQVREYIRTNLMPYLRADNPVMTLASLSGMVNIVSAHVPQEPLTIILREIAEQLPIGDLAFLDLQPLYASLAEKRQKWFTQHGHVGRDVAEEAFKQMVEALDARRNSIRRIMRLYTAPMKEALAARVFRPERIEALIAAYGPDVLDNL